jgi:hypothetical protein
LDDLRRKIFIRGTHTHDSSQPYFKLVLIHGGTSQWGTIDHRSGLTGAMRWTGGGGS